MSKIWNRYNSDSPEPYQLAEGDSLKMIPAWSVVLAIVVFVGTMYFLNRPQPQRPNDGPPAAASTTAAATGATAATPGQDAGPHRPPRPNAQAGHLMFSYTTAAALASYILLLGYVSRDVKRRNMSGPLWMLIVLVMPGGIGAVVYFLLRQPILIRCPSCTTELTSGVHFCPQCRFQVAPVCGQCFRGVQITDAFCPQCGHNVAEDHAPSRLRAYSDV